MTETIMCSACGRQKEIDGFRTCPSCRKAHAERLRKYREREKLEQLERELETAKKWENMEESTRRRELARISSKCAGCAYRTYVGDHRFTCPSAYGTCIREDAKNYTSEVANG